MSLFADKITTNVARPYTTSYRVPTIPNPFHGVVSSWGANDFIDAPAIHTITFDLHESNLTDDEQILNAIKNEGTEVNRRDSLLETIAYMLSMPELRWRTNRDIIIDRSTEAVIIS